MWDGIGVLGEGDAGPLVELFGQPPIDNPAVWFFFLVALVVALRAVKSELEAYIAKWRQRPNALAFLEGYILPVGWTIWGGLLLWAHLEPVPVLIVFLGLALILASGRPPHGEPLNQ
jgi:hypothetical protein